MEKEEIEKKRNEAKAWAEKASFCSRMRNSRYYDDYNNDHPVMKEKFKDEFEYYSQAITCLALIPKTDRTKEDYSLIDQYCSLAKYTACYSGMPGAANLIEELAKFYAKEAAEKEEVLTKPSALELSESNLSSNKSSLFNSAKSKDQNNSEDNRNEQKEIPALHRYELRSKSNKESVDSDQQERPLKKICIR